MKVTINHDQETKGFFASKSVYVVHVQVEFEAEEEAIIAKEKIKNDIVLERPGSALWPRWKREDPQWQDATPLTVAKLKKGDTWAFDTPGEASDYDNQLRENLQHLKDFILARSGDAPTGTSTFEL